MVRCHTTPVGPLACVACCLLVLGGYLPVDGQPRKPPTAGRPSGQERNEFPAKSPTDLQVRELGDTVAILPWNFKNARDTAVQSAHEVCSQLLLATGFNVFLVKTPTGAMPPLTPSVNGTRKSESAFAHLFSEGRRMVTQDAPNKPNASFLLPTYDEMMEIGEKMHTRYVLAGRAQWRSRQVWIGVSNRIKSLCNVDLLILDVSTKRFVLDVHDVEGDSTENKNLYTTVTSVMSLNPLPLVMPGSIKPHEQQAVTVAIVRALTPWLKKERQRMALDQADESGEETPDGKQTVRFSTLLNGLSDIQASLHVTVKDPKPLAAVDGDLARLCALQDVTFQYKEPSRMRLSAVSPKDGKETLLFNGEHRSFAVERAKGASQQDLTDAPTRRTFLFEFCGLISPEMFDTLRARFVKQERLAGVDAVVYDLTYWGLEEGPYYRIWIDPDQRLIVKSEKYDRDGKRKATTLYKQPMEVAPDNWLPGYVEMQDANQKTFATIKITNVQVDQRLPENLFFMEKH